MAHDSKLTRISDDFPQTDASKETPKDLVSLKQEDGITAHSGTSSGEKEQEPHAFKESRKAMSPEWIMPPEESLTAPSKRDIASVRSIEMSVPLLVVPAPSLQTVSSAESFQSLDKESDDSEEKVLGQTAASLEDETELEASGLMNEEASPAASKDDSPDTLHSLMNCRICQLFVRTVDRLLDKSEEMMDQYLPLTEEEINSLKLAVEELDASPADYQKSACLDRITALSSRLRQRTYMMALGKLRLARRDTHSSLSQLQQTLDLIEHAQQEEEPEFQQSHEKLNEICSRWTQQRQSNGEVPPHKQEDRSASHCQTEAGTPLTEDRSTETSKDGNTVEASIPPLAALRNTMDAGAPSAKDHSSNEAQVMFTAGTSLLAARKNTMDAGAPSANDHSSDEIESKTLEMSRTLTLDLQGTYKNLLANLKGLPLNLKRKLYQTYRHMVELHARLTVAHSFADLPGSILEKGLQFMAQAQESMDEVLEFAFQNPMGMWAEEQPPAPVMPETSSAWQEEGDILKIQAAYDPKGCDDNVI